MIQIFDYSILFFFMKLMNYEIEIENYTMIKKLQMIFPDIKYYIVYRLSHNRKGQSSTPGGMEKTRILFENTWMKRQKRKRRKYFRSSQRPGNSIRENYLLVKRMDTSRFFERDHLYQWNFIQDIENHSDINHIVITLRNSY